MMLLGVAGTVAVHASTIYISQGGFGVVRKQVREFIGQQTRISIDIAGDPSIGPADAPLTLVEFSDFFCPACQRAAKMNTVLLAAHRRDLRFVFKHFPLDSSCNDKISRMVHPGACQVAAASECAHAQGKFWPFHDMLFEYGHTYQLANLEGDIGRLGMDVAAFKACMASGQGLEAVKRDIAEGAAKAKVVSTPTFVFNGIPLAGGLNPAVFDDFSAALKEAGK